MNRRLLGTFNLGILAVLVAASCSPGSSDAPAIPSSSSAPENMVWIPGGEFTMGSDGSLARPREKPPHRVKVDGFFMDITPVTNAQFRAFVDATSHVTTSEKPADLTEIMAQLPPGTPEPAPEKLAPASVVFTPPDHAVPVDNHFQWWSYVQGADWRHPQGPDSSVEGKDDHPVVHVSWDDAMAYAKWAGKRLATEAEWEFGARGGLDGKVNVWGNEPLTEESGQANTWQGAFPNKNAAKDGYSGTSPVRAFKPNGYGLYDMAGNVWEWCSDFYRIDTYADRPLNKATLNPVGPESSYDAREPFSVKRVQKGGSYLCHDSYCSGYRPSAREPGSPDTGSAHTGFRCVSEDDRSKS